MPSGLLKEPLLTFWTSPLLERPGNGTCHRYPFRCGGAFAPSALSGVTPLDPEREIERRAAHSFQQGAGQIAGFVPRHGDAELRTTHERRLLANRRRLGHVRQHA